MQAWWLNCPVFFTAQDKTCGQSLVTKQHPVQINSKVDRRDANIFISEACSCSELVLMITCPKTPFWEAGFCLTSDECSSGSEVAYNVLNLSNHLCG